MALWSGRFTENVSEFTQRFGASLPVDKALYAQDIAGSQAHARMLASSSPPMRRPSSRGSTA